MIINVTYFGQLTEIAGGRSESITLNGSTIACLLEQVGNEKPELNDKIFAIFLNNQKVSEYEHVLQHNDEICLMPPFAGG